MRVSAVAGPRVLAPSVEEIMSEQPLTAIFSDRHKFQDDVWGEIRLNNLERDVVDTPEYQRLFRTSQLGFVDLVYQTANHTRGAHSIGACHIAQKLMERLKKNTTHDCSHERYAQIEISAAEQVLIRLGALLHDITHVPFSHDIERKNHQIWYNRERKDRLKVPSRYGQYDKHDDYDSNPLLYLLVFDTAKSILARVLEAYSKPFTELLLQDSASTLHSHLQEFVKHVRAASGDEWDPKTSLLPELLFHLLIFEKPEEADELTAHDRKVAIDYGLSAPKTKTWGIGPSRLRRELHLAWYQPFRHDIIGNTLSADLIDYLKRDLCRLGMAREIDLHLLNYYVLINPQSSDFLDDGCDAGQGSAEARTKRPTHYRCAIEIQDQRRGTSRVVLINDIFRLLDLRHEIHEKAVMHRVVQSANAMLARALLLLDDHLPSAQALAKFGDQFHALQGEDLFLHSLLATPPGQQEERVAASIKDSRRIIGKLIDRRVYRPLLIIPGDRAEKRFQIRGNKDNSETDTEYRLRTLGALLDSRFYSPFLLFVSTCIEEFLTGLFNDATQILDEARSLANNATRRNNAMKLIPSRVLIWTTPYKQLYKDPGLIVALKNRVEQIDQLASPGTNVSTNESALIDLVKASIRHADSKYANLWKIYVFISDGIYYTGILNKLMRISPKEQGQTVATHAAKLKNCEALAIAALEAICEHWSNYCDDESKTEMRGKLLNGQMPGNDFESLVESWIPKYKNIRPSNPTRGLSEVDIEQYVHEWNQSGCTVEDKCRDIRYKFPAPSKDAWSKAKTSSATSAERQLVGLLEACGVMAHELSEAEFQQLVSQVDEKFENRYRALLEGNGKSLHRADLKILWPSAILPELVTTKTNEASISVGIPTRNSSNQAQPSPSPDEQFPGSAPDVVAADWSTDMFELPSDEQLAKFGITELLKVTVEASRSEFIKALFEFSPSRNEGITKKSEQVWSAFLAALSKSAARKVKGESPNQKLTRGKDDWLRALRTKDEL
jgi:HD superfamily phosphohydrolase